MTFKVEGLPSSIRIGAYDVEIVVEDRNWSDAHAAIGHFSGAQQRMTIVQSSASSQASAETVIHEIMHAVWWAYGLEDADPQERTVTLLSAGLTQVWRDNPQLMAWIDKAAVS